MAIRADETDRGRDRALVEAWQAGDGTAFDDLYQRYFDRLRSFCHRRVQNRADAEEIAQEAFVKALHALPTLDGERRFYPWVSVIAHRLCMDHHRRLARVRPSDEVDPGTTDDDTAGRLALQSDLADLDRALERLGPRHAEVLDLRERRGMSYHEIADHLAVPHSTVEALLFRARKALRREFAAVSGERLAGVPAITWLALRVERLRERFGDAGAALAAPVTAGAVAAVIGLASPGVEAPSTPVATVAGRPAHPAASAEVLTTGAPAPTGPSVPHLHAPAPSRAAEVPAAPERGGSAVLVAAGVQVTDQEHAREEAADMPVLVDLGDVGVAVDPQVLITSATELLSSEEDR